MKRRKRSAVHFAFLTTGAGILLAAVAIKADASGGGGGSYDPYPGPSPWGPDDEAGQSNTQTPAKVLEAKKLIKTGKVYALGHEYSTDTLLFPSATPLTFTPDSFLPNGRNFAFSENVCGSIGQMGTQFDALGHFGILPPNSNDPADTLFYNQFTGAEAVGPEGLLHLGVEHVKPFVTRGVLLDIKRYANGGQTMGPTQPVTLNMVRATLHAQKMKESDIHAGDVVLIFTGWEEKYALGENAYYFPTGSLAEPGINLEVAIWLADKGVACVGSDDWAIEVVPSVDGIPGVFLPVHNHMLVKSGVFLHESLKLRELADDLVADFGKGGEASKHAYEFFYTFSPMPIRGASGSPGIPLAIR